MSVSERDIEVCMAYYTDGEQVACNVENHKRKHVDVDWGE